MLSWNYTLLGSNLLLSQAGAHVFFRTKPAVTGGQHPGCFTPLGISNMRALMIVMTISVHYGRQFNVAKPLLSKDE